MMQKCENKQVVHALVMPWPAQGHINPIMHFSKKLAAHGVAITFLNTDFNHQRLLRSQEVAANELSPNFIIQNDGNSTVLQYMATPGTLYAPIRLLSIPDGLSAHDYIINNVHKQCQALMDMTPRLIQLVQCLHPPITCIISDIFVICVPAVAKLLDVPHIGFWTQNAASYAAHVLFTRDHAKLREFMIDENDSSVDENSRPITFIPGCPPMKPKEVNTFLQPCDPSHFIFSYLIQNFKDALDCSHIILNTFHALEAESLDFIHRPNMLVMGPLLPSEYLSTNGTFKKLGTSMWVEDDGCLAWLNEQNPDSVLYVSFGSITLMSAQQITEFAAGLEASGCPVLMVVRPAMMFGEEAVFPQSFTNMMKGRTSMFVQWAPQLQVLAHPSVGGFLTHCGWNSTLEAICQGVPMLCWPYFADQMLDCRCVVDSWKIGLEFQEDKSSGLVSRGEIEAKVKYLMDPSSSKEMREQAHKLGMAAKEAYYGSSRDNLKLFINFLLE